MSESLVRRGIWVGRLLRLGFLGLGKVRGRRFNLRRSLALKKAYKNIKKIGYKERRVVNDLPHKISRAIINEALENNYSIIILGDLKGITKIEGLIESSTTGSHISG